MWERIDINPFDGMEQEKPSQRNSCSWVLDEDYLYVFGGFSFNGRLNDVHKFDFKQLIWTQI